MRAWLALFTAALVVGGCSSSPPMGGAGGSPDARPDLAQPADGDAPAGTGGADASPDLPAADVPGPPDNRDATDGGDAVDTAPPVGARTVGQLYCPPAGTALAPSPLPPGQPQPAQIPFTPPGGITFLEGPVWLADRGVLLFSEFGGMHRILQLTPPQTVDVFLPDSGTNGLAVTPDGKALLMVTEVQAKTVSRLALADKAVQPVVSDFNGQTFIQPNDLVVRADGTIFFTDYQAGRLYRRAVNGTLALISSLPRSNGVGLSPDETTLYLNADTHTVKYPLAPDGTVGTGTDLATNLRGADGLAIDCAGNIFIAQNAGGSLVVMSPAGQKLGEIGGLPMVVTNAAFGGADRQTLYITTSAALYSLKLAIPGLPY